MLTPEYLASFSSGYLGMVDNLNEQIVRDIARRMIKTGKVTDTAKWQIKQAQESGKLLDDIVAEVGRFTGYSDKHVKELFKEAGVTGIRNDAKPLIEAGIINDAKLSRNMSDLLLANAKKTSGDINNLTMTTAVKSQQLYMQSLNEALLKIQSGAFSYQEALRYIWAIRTLCRMEDEDEELYCQDNGMYYEPRKPNYPLLIVFLFLAGIFWPLVILFAVFVPLTFVLMDKMGQLHPNDDEEIDPEEDTYL